MNEPHTLYIDDVSAYYNVGHNWQVWARKSMPTSGRCKYIRLRGYFLYSNGQVDANALQYAIDEQAGGETMQPLDAVQAILHGHRTIRINSQDPGRLVSRQILAAAIHQANQDFPNEEADAIRRINGVIRLLTFALESVITNSSDKGAIIRQAVAEVNRNVQVYEEGK